MKIKKGKVVECAHVPFRVLIFFASSVLRQVAKSIIIAPGWNDETANPIVLVHGMYSRVW